MPERLHVKCKTCGKPIQTPFLVDTTIKPSDLGMQLLTCSECGTQTS